MGFLSGLGKVVGNIARGVSKGAGFVTKISNFLKTPIDTVLAPVKNIVGGALDKLPFGLGRIAKPFVEKFFNTAASWFAGGTLGGLGILAKAMPTVEKLADLAGKIGKAADLVGEAFPPQAQENTANIVAEAHAGLIS